MKFGMVRKVWLLLFILSVLATHGVLGKRAVRGPSGGGRGAKEVQKEKEKGKNEEVKKGKNEEVKKKNEEVEKKKVEVEKKKEEVVKNVEVEKPEEPVEEHEDAQEGEEEEEDEDEDEDHDEKYDDDDDGYHSEDEDEEEDEDEDKEDREIEEAHEALTFRAPFTEVEKYSGERLINEFWETHGDAKVQKNFIRLTPDRQSKNGAIWSRQKITTPETIVFEFRISGQGEKFFGDGIGLWITDSPRYRQGPIHGSQEKFHGIGVIFDTFKNLENANTHRDVLVLVNDGQKTMAQMIAPDVLTGCNMNFRYHEKREDFSIKKSSRAKIHFVKEGLTIEIDKENNGVWTPCVEIKALGLEDFLDHDEIYVGMTASTGELADNHDVLGLSVHTELEDFHYEEARKLDNRSNHPFDEENSEMENIEALFDLVQVLKDRVEELEHELEHSTLAIDDEIKTVAKAIEKHLNEEGEHLEDIDEIIKEVINEHLEEHFEEAEDIQEQLKVKASDKMKALHEDVAEDFEEYLNELSTSHEESWTMPFVLVLIVVGVLGGGMFAFHRTMKKMHMI